MQSKSFQCQTVQTPAAVLDWTTVALNRRRRAAIAIASVEQLPLLWPLYCCVVAVAGRAGIPAGIYAVIVGRAAAVAVANRLVLWLWQRFLP